MKISTKGRYGLEAMLGMAILFPDGVLKISEISDFCHISQAYLTQIFITLRRAGIVNSIRGPQGGYRLAKAPEKITVGNIIRALEGSLYPVEDSCRAKETGFNTVATEWLWNGMEQALASVIDEITLWDLVDHYHNMEDNGSDIEYYI